MHIYNHRWTSIHTVLLEPIGCDRQDSVRFSIAETELTIPESALGDGHKGGASASTPLQLWDSRFVNRCEGTSFVDASDRATCRVHFSMARDRNGSKALIPHGFTACFWAGIGHDTICAGRGFGTSWEQQQVGCAGLTHAQRVPSSRCPELVHIHLGPWRPRKRCPSQAPHHSSLKNAKCAESYAGQLLVTCHEVIPNATGPS